MAIDNGCVSEAANPFAAVPTEMKEAKRWLLHKHKVPHYADGSKRRGQLDAQSDIDRLASFGDALAALESGSYCGLGFALGPDGTGNYWQGIDLDDVEANGLQELAISLPGYVELSPSGNGVHAIGYGNRFPALGAKDGIEAYCERRFFTVTGIAIRSSL